jgi:hypothetical protein
VGYNAGVVNFYNATGSLARFENKNTFFCFGKCLSLALDWLVSSLYYTYILQIFQVSLIASVFMGLGTLFLILWVGIYV